MKSYNLFKFCFMLLFIASCQESSMLSEPEMPEGNFSLGEMRIDLSNAPVFDPEGIIVSRLEEGTDLTKVFENFEREIASEFQAAKEENSQLESMTFVIKFYKDKIVITDGFLEEKGKEAISLKTNMPVVIIEDSPQGWTELGTSSTLQPEAERTKCVADLLTGFYTDELTDLGSCAQTQVKVGALNITVCGKSGC